jgi:hypothetical protein
MSHEAAEAADISSARSVKQSSSTPGFRWSLAVSGIGRNAMVSDTKHPNFWMPGNGDLAGY